MTTFALHHTNSQIKDQLFVEMMQDCRRKTTSFNEKIKLGGKLPLEDTLQSSLVGIVLLSISNLQTKEAEGSQRYKVKNVNSRIKK